MLDVLQRFVKKELAYMKQQGDIQFIYDTGGELVGEIHMEHGLMTQIDFYDADAMAEAGIPFCNSAILNAMLRPNAVPDEVDAPEIARIAREMKEALDDRMLQLEYVVDFDVNYLAVFEEVESRYGLTIPNTGLQLAIRRDGTLSSASFMRKPFTIVYPEHMISKEEARNILIREPLVQLSIEQQEDWRYVYTPTFDVYGVEVDGQLKRLGKRVDYERLPDAAPITESLEAFLQGGRSVSVPLHEEESVYWEYATDEDTPKPVLEEPAFQRACRALQAVVGSAYSGYELEQQQPLPTDDGILTYRFVYCHQGIYVTEHAAEITVHQTTGQIEAVEIPTIPFEQLATLQPPLITLQEANTLAHQLVDVTLAMERVDRVENLYTVVYVMEYPDSPTQGAIQYIDAYTGEISFVETGLLKED